MGDNKRSEGQPQQQNSAHLIQKPSLTIIVVDATWRKARRMAKHLSTICSGINGQGSPAYALPHVALSTTALSEYRRKQSCEGEEVVGSVIYLTHFDSAFVLFIGRICTLEAVAMMLELAGEQPANASGV